MTRLQKLKNKVAIVTGASSGIGKAIAIRFAQEGAKVAIVDINLRGGEKTVKEIKKLGRKAIAFKTDVSKPQQVSKTTKEIIKKFGQINILVNNAGISRPAGILSQNVQKRWQEVLATNLTGAFLMTEAVVKQMVKHKWQSNIINITSVHSQVPTRNGAFYTAAKAGLAGATKSWALELAEHNIRVNAIAPGAIMNTGMNPQITPKNDKKLAKKWRIPLGRNGKPEEIADAAVFLATNQYITGQEIVVDGGYTLTH